MIVIGLEPQEFSKNKGKPRKFTVWVKTMYEKCCFIWVETSWFSSNLDFSKVLISKNGWGDVMATVSRCPGTNRIRFKKKHWSKSGLSRWEARGKESGHSLVGRENTFIVCCSRHKITEAGGCSVKAVLFQCEDEFRGNSALSQIYLWRLS